ncbi:hypothetical protein [Streptomyces rapamycinicus]|uniref:Uncharacterized protein n=2 Tax=Streptomyces rapamycinicus TaxID=1226757 RepID=A0A3L8RG08_STRRN|nr:hypothetical protein [Streptomyces rapamycinicus]MBB4786020.1 hypothetical protein [Streptomyces rapamycinicus]RLV78517.1 hypothetical protein D3C57_109070 [Streptomyces rapamycinicus NRRL 5491]UTO66142.1 hypothetical protein LJB45_30030 [Streptomyces rapamycinicus]UTP34096.1 hypothetical protein LIV37_35165 [Streptomyces rapamycinicus NRRL 5491]
METASAIELVEDVIYKPGWTFTARDHTKRFESTIVVRVNYPARNSNRDQAETGYPQEITTYAEFPLVVNDYTDEDLYAALLETIMSIEEHEAREFLRVQPTNWAPFHPHRATGMRRWAARSDKPDLMDDLQFGIA